MIGIIGPGRLGICFALLLEKAGHSVIVSDVRESYIDSITNKTVQSNEPQVTTLLLETKDLTAVYKNSQVINNSDIIFAIVATPSLPSGRYDVSALEDIVLDFKKCSNIRGKTLVITSTTNPGDCERFQSLLLDSGVTVLYNPEFIAQGSIVKDIQNADILLLGGNNSAAMASVVALYADIQGKQPNVHAMSLTAAEVVKIAINCYLTTKISYANIVGQVLVSAGLENEVDLALAAIGNDTRIGTKYLNFGHGFGGPCLPRDNRSFGNYASSLGIDFNLGTQIDEFNKSHLMFLKDFYINKNKDSIPFYFRYVSYKENTDIFVESQQLALCNELLNDGYKVFVEDSYLIDSNLKSILTNNGAEFIKKESYTFPLLLIDL